MVAWFAPFLTSVWWHIGKYEIKNIFFKIIQKSLFLTWNLSSGTLFWWKKYPTLPIYVYYYFWTLWFCNISTSESRGRTTIYIDSTILPLEVAGRFSSRSSDRKSRKRQNSTSKQTLNCHGVFSEINSHQSWFLTQTANTLIYFSVEVQKVRGTLPEGFQTFEHHLKVSPSQIGGEFNQG